MAVSIPKYVLFCQLVLNKCPAFDIRPAFVRGRHIQLCLISRRSRYRAGTRYFRRGIDHEGHVANFNETEQLVLVEDNQSSGQLNFNDFSAKLSFVQIRGSVPVFWAEINTLLYKPDLQVMDLQETVRFALDCCCCSMISPSGQRDASPPTRTSKPLWRAEFG